MTSPKSQYISEIRRNLGFTPTWPPSASVEPGDIVLLDDDAPTRIDTLTKKAYRVTFDVRDDVGTSDLRYMSARGVSLTFKASGASPIPNSVLTTADAGVCVEFSHRNACVVEALGCATKRIADQITLGDQILALYQAGQWEREWAVVTEVIRADTVTVFLSSGSNAKIELKAGGTFTAGATSLASANAEFSVAVSKNMATQVIATKHLTPFYRAYGIKGAFSTQWARRDKVKGGPASLEELKREYRALAKHGPIGE
jgi:hypothetical protein